jgi:hypothetical protein
MVRFHNAETDEVVDREMNAAELEQLEIDKTKRIDRIEAEATKAAEKAALLAKLGITDDEAKLLLS